MKKWRKVVIKAVLPTSITRSYLNTNLTDYTYVIYKNEIDVCFSVHRCIWVEKKTQLVVTEYFIALMIRTTCFRHFYAHHQELETICVLLPPMVRSAWLLVVGDQVQDSRLWVQEEGCCSSLLSCNWPPTTINKALHTIGDNNIHIVSSSWWWAYKCPKRVERIVSAIKHSVTSSWFFFSTHVICGLQSSTVTGLPLSVAFRIPYSSSS